MLEDEMINFPAFIKLPDSKYNNEILRVNDIAALKYYLKMCDKIKFVVENKNAPINEFPTMIKIECAVNPNKSLVINAEDEVQFNHLKDCLQGANCCTKNHKCKITKMIEDRRDLPRGLHNKK